MKIIVGLGNPGPQYETTRHNIGFLAIDRLVQELKASGPVIKNGGHLYQAQVGSEKVLLVKPQGFMNLSGQCVGPLFNFYHCSPEDLIVIHDELDLDPFVIRLKTGGGTGGHNGLKSIDESLGKEKQGYHRIRIGIGHPSKVGDPRSPADYVLSLFKYGELKDLEIALDRVVMAVPKILVGDIALVMNELNRK